MSISKDPLVFNQETLSLFNFFLNINDDKGKKNCIFDISSIFRSIYALSSGVNLEQEKVHTVLKLFDQLPKSSYSRSGVFFRSDLEFRESYKDVVSSKNFYVGNIPRNYNDVDKINQEMIKKFPDWPDKNEDFLEQTLSSDLRLYIKDESIFSARWYEPFSRKKTLENFYIGDDKNIKVPMMERDNYDEYMLTYEANNIKWVSLSYKDNRSMLIIMPDKACNYKELVNFCINDLTANDIYRFYNTNATYKLYSTKRMPEFKFESEWELSNNHPKEIEMGYISTLFKPNLDLKNMCENLGPETICDILLNSTSKVHNNEYGTFVRTKTQIFQHDGVNVENGYTLVIDKSFIFMILDKDNKICQIGIYAGNDVP